MIEGQIGKGKSVYVDFVESDLKDLRQFKIRFRGSSRVERVS